MVDKASLREKIREKYKSDTAFALAIGWVPAKVYKLLNCGYIPKMSEAVKIGQALDMSLEELASFYTL